jgi:hypothetical protein
MTLAGIMMMGHRSGERRTVHRVTRSPRNNMALRSITEVVFNQCGLELKHSRLQGCVIA